MKNLYHRSKNIECIKRLLLPIQGTPLPLEERKQYVLELAALLTNEVKRIDSPTQKKRQAFYEEIRKNLNVRALIIQIFDLAFRSKSKRKNAKKLLHIINQFTLPKNISLKIRFQFLLCRLFVMSFPSFLMSMFFKTAYKSLSYLIKQEGTKELTLYTKYLLEKGFKIYYAYLGENFIGEKQAQRRTTQYIEVFKKSFIDHSCIQPSALLTHNNPTANEMNVEKLSDKLRQIFRATKQFSEEQKKTKFVAINAETYDIFYTTIKAFKKVLSEPEFITFSAGIALLSYFPESYLIQKELTDWAKNRIKNGGEPITIRITKGAYLHKEQIVASKKNWKQAPFLSKTQTDANFKRMLNYALITDNARAVHIGVASHNVFDIAYAIVLSVENEATAYISYEVLMGLAENLAYVIKQINLSDVFIYCPINLTKDFSFSVPYISRRCEEIVGPENFMKHIAHLKPGTIAWEEQAQLFLQSCDEIENLPQTPRRNQDRNNPTNRSFSSLISFDNEPDTDFSLPQNITWMHNLLKKWKNVAPSPIPLVIGNEELHVNEEGKGQSPNYPDKTYYTYSLAKEKLIDQAFNVAKQEEKKWQQVSVEDKKDFLFLAAESLQQNRHDFVGSLVMDIGKTIQQADHEVSRTIDILNYYRIRINKTSLLQDLCWHAKGTYLVAPCWSRPCSAAASGIVAALITNNCVILKPPPEAVLVCYLLAKIFWDAGVPKNVLQLINCSDDIAEKYLAPHPHLSAMILFSRSSTAKKFKKINPSLDLIAIANGKNTIIVSSFADLDLVVKDLVISAFYFSGQIYSHCSLAILEKEVYESFSFKQKLYDAANNLIKGFSWDPCVDLPPLIHTLKGNAEKALTTLSNKEQWLLKPRQNPHQANLWSAGIKMGVEETDDFFHHDYPIPLLGLVKAQDMQHAIKLANSTKYGLVAGLYSLDVKEKVRWLDKIESGSFFVNRTITDSMIRREPFGGCKESSFGPGLKSGGPNFLYSFMIPEQKYLPKEKSSVNEAVNQLTPLLEKLDLSAEQLGIWYASIANYAHWWNKMKHERDPSKIIGQDNLFGYIPRKKIALYVGTDKNIFDHLRICAACLTCGASLTILWEKGTINAFDWFDLTPTITVHSESKKNIIALLQTGTFTRLRTVDPINADMYSAAAHGNCYIANNPILANGRIELLNYLREVSLSYDYERYGHLGPRDNEIRKTPL